MFHTFWGTDQTTASDGATSTKPPYTNYYIWFSKLHKTTIYKLLHLVFRTTRNYHIKIIAFGFQNYTKPPYTNYVWFSELDETTMYKILHLVTVFRTTRNHHIQIITFGLQNYTKPPYTNYCIWLSELHETTICKLLPHHIQIITFGLQNYICVRRSHGVVHTD